MKKFKKMMAILLTITLLVCTMPVVVANAGGDEIEITVGNPYEMWVDDSGENLMFKPEADGYYKFYTTGEWDTYATLYNHNWDEISSNDDLDASELNFCIVEKLYAGYTYYLDIDVLSIDEYQTVKFMMYVEETVGVEDVEITQSPYDLTCVEGFEYQTFDPSGLLATFTLSDGTTVDWDYNNDDNEICGTPIFIDIDDDGYNHYFYEITCGEAYAREFLEVVENTIANISIKNNIVMSFYEDTCGYYDEDFGYYVYEYYDYLPDDLTIIVEYTDGTSEEINFFDIPHCYCNDTQLNEAWTVDGTQEIDFFYFDAHTTMPVVIVENPVADLTVTAFPDKEYVFGDEQFGNMEYEDYYLYATDITGLEFSLEYKDGTTQTFTDEDYDIENMLIDGNPYSVDVVCCTGLGTYEVVLHFMGQQIVYDVEVVDKIGFLLGDVDGDGEVAITDATLVQRYLVGEAELDETALLAADANEDGEITILDATAIQRIVAQLD